MQLFIIFARPLTSRTLFDGMDGWIAQVLRNLFCHSLACNSCLMKFCFTLSVLYKFFAGKAATFFDSRKRATTVWVLGKSPFTENVFLSISSWKFPQRCATSFIRLLHVSPSSRDYWRIFRRSFMAFRMVTNVAKARRKVLEPSGHHVIHSDRVPLWIDHGYL